MKMDYSLVMLIILMIAGLEIAFAVGMEPVPLSGIQKPSYYPYPMASSPSGRITASLDTPIAGGVVQSNPQGIDQVLVQERFRIVDDSNQPLVGAQFSGHDGANNIVQGITDDNGDVTIMGVPGNWQFLIYFSGYFSEAMVYPFTYSSSKILTLESSGSLEELNLSGRKYKNDILPTIKITMPAFCSNTTDQVSNTAADQAAYTGDEG
jgi:hypothetical protein